MLLRNKTVVISGVGAGLGHQVAAACVREGASVVLGPVRRRISPSRLRSWILPARVRPGG
ncbi:hypothetical protein Srufu_045240 [Streptomyces libani subsp. rufus]|nr:hypothetical protein Srufu_045240 [Streptomyces libani subsp. rufus]